MDTARIIPVIGDRIAQLQLTLRVEAIVQATVQAIVQAMAHIGHIMPTMTYDQTTIVQATTDHHIDHMHMMQYVQAMDVMHHIIVQATQATDVTKRALAQTHTHTHMFLTHY